MNICFFLLIFIFFYIFLLGGAAYHYVSTKKLIKKMGPLLDNAVSPFSSDSGIDVMFVTSEKDARRHLERHDAHKDYLKLLSLRAKISSKLGNDASSILIGYNQISYNQGVFENLKSMRNSYGDLLDLQHDLHLSLLQKLNPVHTIKFIFLMPSRVLSWFGINLNNLPSKLFSLFTFLVLFIWKSYGTSIIDFLLTFRK